MVHADARRSVHLDDCSGAAGRVGDIGHDEVEPADVEPDYFGRALAHPRDLGMDEVGYITGFAPGRKVRAIAEHDALACRGNRIQRAATALQVRPDDVVDVNATERLRVVVASSGV